MIEQDTVKLLRECDAGVKMGTKSIEDVLDHVKDRQMLEYLNRCREEHLTLAHEIEEALERFGDEGKEPNPMAKGMSWLKTNVKLGLDDSDATVADLMVSGCDMGVKSLSRYLNEYAAADEDSKDIAKRLIHLEETLGKEMRKFL